MLEAGVATLRRPRKPRRRSALALALAALAFVSTAFGGARALVYREAVLPGVTVADLDVGGLERSEARARIAARVAERLAVPVTVTVGRATFTARPSQLFAFNAAATERAAYEGPRASFLSRAAALVVPFGLQHEVEPVLRVRPRARAALARDLRPFSRRAVAARVRMHGLEPVVLPGRFGASVDESAVVGLVRSAALSGDGRVDVDVAVERPPIFAAEARKAAATARAIASAPVEITFGGKRVGELSRRALARAISFRPSGRRYDVVLDREALAVALAPMVARATRKPVDASFAVAGNRVRVVPSRPGTQVAAGRAAAAVLAAASTGGPRSAAIVLTSRPAELTTREARTLGIRERISTFTTLMGESSANRIWNVHLLGRYLDGTIVKPGETFSFNRVLGPRTPERGFREGQMIFGGVLVPSIGGGVCQTATTIFNAAFEAGLPILERENHSFYISHYPVGRDAAVAWGGPDLVFRNDLGNAILIKAHGTSETFTVSFYGTKQGRRVVATTSEPSNYTAPRLQYAVDPSAPAGSVRQTQPGGPGFDVTVFRKVYERQELLREDRFFTRYTPENATAVHGPGATPPGPYFVLPTS